MTRYSTTSPIETRSRDAATRVVTGLRQAFEELRRPGEQRSDARPDRDDARAAVLAILAEQPMNGYQVVRTLEARGSGAHTPGAGVVYPILQQLADEALATAADVDGRKIYTLTDLGRVEAEAARTRSASWEAPGTRGPARRGALMKSGAQLAQAAALVAQSGTADQVAEAAAALDEARRAIHAILARN